MDPLWQLALELRRQVSELQWQLDRLPATFVKSLLFWFRKKPQAGGSEFAPQMREVTLDMIKIGMTNLDKSDVVIAVCHGPRAL